MGRYTVFGYQGKQVRDNIHSYDVARFIEHFFKNPRQGEVYNVDGGRGNSCYISYLSKIKTHYPEWTITKSLTEIFKEIVESWEIRLRKIYS